MANRAIEIVTITPSPDEIERFKAGTEIGSGFGTKGLDRGGDKVKAFSLVTPDPIKRAGIRQGFGEKIALDYLGQSSKDDLSPEELADFLVITKNVAHELDDFHPN